METANSISVGEHLDQFEKVTSKEAGLVLLMDLAYKGIIDQEKFILLGNQLRDSSGLPDSDCMDNHIGGHKKSNKSFTALVEFLAIISFSDSKKNVAFFKICCCGKKHGRIYYRGGFTPLLDSKKQSVFIAKNLRNLSIEELEKVERQIEDSSLLP